VGLARDAQQQLRQLQAAHPQELVVHEAVEVERGLAGLAEQILLARLAHAHQDRGWHDVGQAQARKAVQDAATLAQPASIETRAPDYGRLMRYLRTEVFRCSQNVFGEIAGASYSAVSRWESGHLKPGLDELHRLREFATTRQLPWSDSWVFCPPAPAA